MGHDIFGKFGFFGEKYIERTQHIRYAEKGYGLLFIPTCSLTIVLNVLVLL